MILCLLLFLVIYKIVANKKTLYKNKNILKTRKRLNCVVLKYKIFSSQMLLLNFISLNTVKNMQFQEIKKIDNILTKVKTNIPQTYGEYVDKKYLINCGICEDLPIYIAEKGELDLVKKALNYVNFYCILFDNNIEYQNTFIKVFNKNMISLNILNVLYKLNINYGEVKKLHFNNVIGEVVINNQNILSKQNFDGKFLYHNYELNGVVINIIKYNNNGEFYNIKVENKSAKKQNINISINKYFNYNFTNYYIYKIQKKSLSVHKICGKIEKYIWSDSIVSFKLSKIAEYRLSNFPIVSISKNISISQYGKFEYNLFIGNQKNTNINFKNNMFNYICNLEQRFKIKIKSPNNKIDKLFNKTLPNNIVLDELYGVSEIDNKTNCLLSFDDAILKYANKQISSKQMYEYMLKFYLGITETSNSYIFNPKTKFDFSVFIQNKKVEIRYCNSQKYIEIDGVRYFNISCISKNTFLISSKILLVI